MGSLCISAAEAEFPPGTAIITTFPPPPALLPPPPLEVGWAEAEAWAAVTACTVWPLGS